MFKLSIFKIENGILTKVRSSEAETVKIPDDVVSIGENAFSRRSYKFVVIPPSVTEIDRYAFERSSIESIIIPSTVRIIRPGAFKDCTNLKSVIFENGCLYSIPAFCFENCTSLEEVRLSNNIDIIDTGAFCSCLSLKEIIIPDSVDSISPAAFRSCSNLRIKTTPNVLAKIPHLKEVADVIFPKDTGIDFSKGNKSLDELITDSISMGQTLSQINKGLLER